MATGSPLLASTASLNTLVPVKGKNPAVLLEPVKDIFDKIGTSKQIYSDYEGTCGLGPQRGKAQPDGNATTPYMGPPR